MTDHSGWIDGQGEGGGKASVCVCVCVHERWREIVCIHDRGKVGGSVTALLRQTAIRVIDTVFGSV